MQRLILTVVALFVSELSNAGQYADLVIWGGPIYTGVNSQPKVSAIAVHQTQIAYVGDRSGASVLIGPKTRIVNLNGAAMYPGFTDGHAHLRTLGDRQLTLNLEGARSAAEVTARLRAYVRAHSGTGLVYGAGWMEIGWPEKRFLNRADLDGVAPDRSVILKRGDGHAVTVNSAALRAAGVDEHTSVPAGGQIEKDADGRLTGLLVDTAMSLVTGLRAAPTEAERVADFRAAFELENALGWTGMHSMSVEWTDVLLLENLARHGEVPMRIYNCVNVPDAEPLFASGPRSTPDGRVVTRAIAEFGMDGGLGSRGAALFAPYSDAPGWSGAFTNEPDAMMPVLARALARGIQVAIHAVGDRGNATVLDLYRDIFATLSPGSPSPRWRIEHAQILRPEDIPRFGQMGVIASMQPSHFVVDFRFVPARLGAARLKTKGAYAWKSLLDSGAVVVGGSDTPWEGGNPLLQFYAAVARKDLNGRTFPDSHPEEALSREQALRLFTSASAYARFAETELGTIEIGKRADLSAFSLDLMTAPIAAIPNGHAVLTVVDGQVVYSAL